MNGMPSHNPLTTAAKESIEMSKETGDKNFKLLAVVMMGVSGIAAIMHAVHVIYHDLKPARQRDQNTSEPVQPQRQAGHQGGQDEGPQTSWVHKARVGERPASSPRTWTEHAAQPRTTRQH